MMTKFWQASSLTLCTYWVGKRTTYPNCKAHHMSIEKHCLVTNNKDLRTGTLHPTKISIVAIDEYFFQKSNCYKKE